MRSSLALIAAATLQWSASAEAKDLRSADVYAADHPTVQAVAYLGERLQERTRGRQSIRTLGADNRGSELFTIASVRNGTLDMARVNLASLSNLMPEAIVPALPALFRSTDHMQHVLDGPVGQDLLAALDRFDLVGLCFYPTGARSYYGSKPIRKASDLAGLKVRVPQAGLWVSLMKVPGMVAIPMPYEQIALGLQTGAIDLAENNWPAFVASRHYETAKYFSLTQHTATPSVLIFSKRTWAELSDGDKAALRATARESVGVFRRLWDEQEAQRDSIARVTGVELVSDIDRDSFVKAAVPIYDKEASTPALQDMIRRIRMTP
ncbi:tripartite ATP-independent transporter solute receptor, DctP family [Enhydrobacter aerosaccus]|uniref:Tripartite ATP-independent transporter solute receptor, DctP family n=1 Tax=Enhydrobacter aerosaccus TaxID=225324 RepID=A0A1T4T0T6_9HYPH|nr:TRAP transporter substrate-binding protein DctP [Enhydrobacter aerosaccus]SKA34085.1 tripartite ATP-independent transporter solute receptor, DctP family [Enhydrobacter aerosaccus]